MAIADNSILSQIRAKHPTIQNILLTLQQTSISLESYGGEGAEAAANRENQSIKLIKAGLYGETDKVVEEFYYDSGKIMFAFYQHHHYNVPFYITAEENGAEPFNPNKTKITENRYYFDNGKMPLT